MILFDVMRFNHSRAENMRPEKNVLFHCWFVFLHTKDPDALVDE